MPTYDYSCTKCGKDFELIQSIKAKPLKTCPKDSCQQSKWGKGKVKRLLGTGGSIIFKGSGFYGTDYRSANYQAGAKKDSEGSSSTPKESKADSSTKATPSPAPAATPAPASKPAAKKT